MSGDSPELSAPAKHASDRADPPALSLEIAAPRGTDMIANHRRVWGRKFSAAGVIACLASCSGPPKEIEDDGAIQGELAMYVATFDDGTTETNYTLRSP